MLGVDHARLNTVISLDHHHHHHLACGHTAHTQTAAAMVAAATTAAATLPQHRRSFLRVVHGILLLLLLYAAAVDVRLLAHFFLLFARESSREKDIGLLYASLVKYALGERERAIPSLLTSAQCETVRSIPPNTFFFWLFDRFSA